MENLSEIKKWFEERTEQIIDWEGLEEKMKNGKQILIKFGADPSKPDLHLGHGVCLRMMRKMQDECDAKVQFLIGDFTGQIGDPSGKSKTREALDKKKVKENALSYAKQVFMILDETKTEIWANGSKLDFVENCQGGWWDEMSLSDFLSLLTMVTHAKLIDRDMFQERIKNGQEIYMHEMMYPILQGYDSVKMESDLTIVGNDQLFNELMGRFFQERFEQKPQTIMTAPILVGLDGQAKMSKSLGNYIGLTDSAEDMFGKTMSIPDKLIVEWAKFLTDLDWQKIDKRLEAGENPRDLKMILATDIVRQYHGENEANEARKRFVKFCARELDDIINDAFPDLFDNRKYDPFAIVIASGIVQNISNSEIHRKINEGAVSLDGEKIYQGQSYFVRDGAILKYGKRKFLKLRKKKI